MYKPLQMRPVQSQKWEGRDECKDGVREACCHMSGGERFKSYEHGFKSLKNTTNEKDVPTNKTCLLIN